MTRNTERRRIIPARFIPRTRREFRTVRAPTYRLGADSSGRFGMSGNVLRALSALSGGADYTVTIEVETGETQSSAAGLAGAAVEVSALTTRAVSAAVVNAGRRDVVLTFGGRRCFRFGLCFFVGRCRCCGFARWAGFAVVSGGCGSGADRARGRNGELSWDALLFGEHYCSEGFRRR